MIETDKFSNESAIGVEQSYHIQFEKVTCIRWKSTFVFFYDWSNEYHQSNSLGADWIALEHFNSWKSHILFPDCPVIRLSSKREKFRNWIRIEIAEIEKSHKNELKRLFSCSLDSFIRPNSNRFCKNYFSSAPRMKLRGFGSFFEKKWKSERL